MCWLHECGAGTCATAPHLTPEAWGYAQISGWGCRSRAQGCWDVSPVLPVHAWERLSNSFCLVRLLHKAFCTKPFWVGGLSHTAGASPEWASFLFATAGATRLVVKGSCSLPVTRHSDPRHLSACCLCSQPGKVPMPGEDISQQETTFNAVTMSSLQETSYLQLPVLQLRQASLLLSWENRAAIHVHYEKQKLRKQK